MSHDVCKMLIRAALVPDPCLFFGVERGENRLARRVRGKQLKMQRFLGLESGWNVAGIRLAIF